MLFTGFSAARRVPAIWLARKGEVFEPSLCSTRQSVEPEDWRQSRTAPSRIKANHSRHRGGPDGGRDHSADSRAASLPAGRTGPPAETMKRARQGGRATRKTRRRQTGHRHGRPPQNLQPKRASSGSGSRCCHDRDRVRDQNYWEDVVSAAGLAAGPSDSGGMSAAAITSSGSRFHTCVLPSKGIPRYPRTERFLPSGLNSILAW